MDEHGSTLHETPVKKRKPNPENEKSSSAGEEKTKVVNGDDVKSDLPTHLERDVVDGLSTQECEVNGPSSPASSTPSESDWHCAPGGCYQWMHEQMLAGTDPREVIQKILPSVAHIPDEVDTWTLWKLVIQLISEPPRRRKLPNINTFEDAVNLIKSSRKIIVLTGAGVSVSCGIPDFRSRDGVYARLAVDFPDLPSPESMFDISYFRQDPRPFFKFAKEIYPGQFKPSRIHKFIATLDKTGRLLRNYTQNIDTLEQVAGIKNVIQCHGSFATATCQVCKYQTDSETIREDIFKQVIPRCPRCEGDEPGILKPDIVFFGENLPDHFHRQMVKDKEEVDLLIVIGSALKVRPVALIPSSIPTEVPQILINREALNHMTFDVDLLGDGDTVVSQICRHLGDDFAPLLDGAEELAEITSLPESANSSLNHSDSPATKKPDSQDAQHLTNGVAGQETPATSRDQSSCKTCADSPLNGDKSPSTHSRLSHDTCHMINSEQSGSGSVCEDSRPSRTFVPVHNKPVNHESTHDHGVSEKMNHDHGASEATDHDHGMNEETNNDHGVSEETNNDHGVSEETNNDHDLSEKIINDHGMSEEMNHDHIVNEESNHDHAVKEGPLKPGNALQEGHINAQGDTNAETSPSGDSPERLSMKGFWQSRWKQSISKRLPAGCYYYDGKHRYIFPGAEVPPEEESDSSSDEDTDEEDSSSSSDRITGISPLRRHPVPSHYRPHADASSSASQPHRQQQEQEEHPRDIEVTQTDLEDTPATAAT